MPELPEVETVRLQLLHYIVGKTIGAVEVFHAKTVGFNEYIEDTLIGQTIADIDRVGKLLIFSFATQSDLFMLAHLKMTGQFFYVDNSVVTGGGHSMSESDVAAFPGKHTRLALQFTDSTTLYFNDMRLFGYVHTATATEVATARAKFGQEPIAEDFDVVAFTERLRKRKTPVKAALLDQSFVAGLGNIYVDEALWHAKVRPTRIAAKVTKAEAAAIAKYAGEVMNHSIKVGGTTFQHFKDTAGEKGNYTKHLQVFGKQGTPCPRCGADITKIRCAGRGTHYCPKCQK